MKDKDLSALEFCIVSVIESKGSLGASCADLVSEGLTIGQALTGTAGLRHRGLLYRTRVADGGNRHFLTDRTTGKERLSRLFGLSYASFLVLPRSLMQEMPDGWQDRCVDLVKEFDSEYPNQPDGEIFISWKEGGKFAKLPESLGNYRRPDRKAIEKMRVLISVEDSPAAPLVFDEAHRVPLSAFYPMEKPTTENKGH